MKKFNSNSISRNNKYNGAGGAGGGGTASDIAYDNSLSGLVSENVQQAIDELHDEIEIGNIYTTDEKKVGEWVDGKPIYSKYILITNTKLISNRWVDFDVSDLNVGYLVYGRVYCGTIIPAAHMYLDVNAQSVKVNGNYWSNEVDVSGLYIEYTKTTD